MPLLTCSMTDAHTVAHVTIRQLMAAFFLRCRKPPVRLSSCVPYLVGIFPKLSPRMNLAMRACHSRSIRTASDFHSSQSSSGISGQSCTAMTSSRSCASDRNGREVSRSKLSVDSLYAEGLVAGYISDLMHVRPSS